MRITVCFLFFFAILGSIAAPAHAQLPLSPEVQQMLNLLPSQQRDELLRQYSQMRTPAPAPVQRPAEGTERAAAPAEQPAEAEPEADVETIRAGDTLVIEIRRPEDSTASAHLLEGRRAVILDRFGRLNLPGLTDIPLAGLDAEQAEHVQ